jgi:hypothetical protein
MKEKCMAAPMMGPEEVFWHEKMAIAKKSKWGRRGNSKFTLALTHMADAVSDTESMRIIGLACEGFIASHASDLGIVNDETLRICSIIFTAITYQIGFEQL